MKRRDFFKGSILGLGVLSSSTSLASGRLYGTPGSIHQKPLAKPGEHIRLPLAKSQLPPELMTKVGKYAAVWQQALSNKEYRTNLIADPEQALLSTGITADEDPLQQHELAVLLATWDPEITEAISKRDYARYLKQLKRYFSSEQTNSIAQQRHDQIHQQIQRHGIEMISQFNKTDLVKSMPSEMLNLAQGEELALLASSVCGGSVGGAVVGAAVVAVVAAIAVTYVSVGVNVTVALNAGVYLSVAVKTAVTVSGAQPSSAFDSAPQTLDSAPQTLEEQLKHSTFPDLKGEDYTAILSAARIAHLKGDQLYAIRSSQELIRQEVDIAFDAAEQESLIHIHPDQRDVVVSAAANYVLQVIGLPKMD